ncbi:MAG: hypothetical protein AAGE65_10235 [Planctomycetota bacterium]
MLAAFITPIQVTNDTDRPLRVTPIGAVGPEGERVLLPVFRERRGGFVPAPRGDFPLSPGQTLEILYDWDDTNLAEIVVAQDDGTLGQLVADPNPEQGQYRMPDPNRFTIEDVATLDPVPPTTAILLSRADRSIRVHPFVVLLIVLPWLSFAVLVGFGFWRKRLVRASPLAVTTPPTGSNSSLA